MVQADTDGLCEKDLFSFKYFRGSEVRAACKYSKIVLAVGSIGVSVGVGRDY